MTAVEPGARHLGPLRWQAVIIHRVDRLVLPGEQEAGGWMAWPVGWAPTQRLAWWRARRHITKNRRTPP